MALTGAFASIGTLESDNWIRDVTLHEDHSKTTSANQAQITGCYAVWPCAYYADSNVKNFQEALEDLADCPSRFEAC